jgi:biopolymer transport protein ExbD
MSKRDIPEINAGSMADIAFLLLIFFLVTTTMDKDQAYIRSIPKKILVPQEPVPVQERDILAIKANNLNQLMVRGEIISDPDKISDKILEFYRTNEKANGAGNNFPLYGRTSMSLVNSNINTLEAEAEKLENENFPSEQIEFKYAQLAEWEKKKNAMKLYGANELPEISGAANIRIEVNTATDYSLFAKIQTEIEEAIYELRDGESKRLFGESYGVIKKRFNQDENNEDKRKLELLDILYPARVIEVTPKN